MSGQAGARGYLLQAMICVLDSLTDDSDWTNVTIEPNDESDKVDIIWTFPNSRKAVQVKHSTNRIGLPDATRWAEELEHSVEAGAYELRLLGPIADNLRPKDGMIGRVTVPPPEAVNIPALRRHAAHNLDLYLTAATPSQRLRPIVREIIVDALSNRLGSLSTEGTTFSRADFDKMLRKWVNEILLQSGCESASAPSSEQRLHRLEQLLANSHGRRVARWQAAGLSREIAISLSENEAVGGLPDEAIPNEKSPLRLVVAPLGAGKSLAAERFFESCVRLAMQSVSSPVPVFIEALRVQNSLEDAIRAAADVVGEPTANGAYLVLDGLDDLSSRAAQRLLSEARAIVNSWPGSRAILTGRSMRCWDGVEERITLPQLDEATSLQLVALSSSWSASELERASWSWSRGLKETIRTPLFAILLGKSLKYSQESERFSRAGLIAHLVERAIGNAVPNSDSIKQVCRTLATECLDRSGAVPVCELEPRNTIEQLLPTGLVVESGGFVTFALPVLTQWFAAQAIAEGDVSVESFWNYPGRIDRWRSAIAIIVGTASAEIVERILAPIAHRDPGFLLIVVDEATAHWSLDTGATPPNAVEAARRIRSAMQACVNGIGKLAAVITPINPQTGHLLPTATRTEGEWLIAGWSLKAGDGENASLPPEIGPPGPWKAGDKVLPGHEQMSQFSYGLVQPYWIDVRGARPGCQSAWAWRWIVEHLQTKLKNRMKPGSIFDICAPPLVAEAAWHSAIELLKLGWLHSEPIPLKLVRAELPLSAQELESRSQAFQRTVVKRGWKDVDVTMLVLECARLEALGATELVSPLPLADRTEQECQKASFPWQRFSEARTFERIRALCERAVAGYGEIVGEWFAPMAGRLDRAATLPARLLVNVDMKEGQTGATSFPILTIRWEPLPKNATTQVVLQPGIFEFGALDPEALSRLREQLGHLRPEFVESLAVLITHAASHDMFSDFAIRTLVYKWLVDDLRRINWIA
ncbi:MAG TPA: hypothetical protein VND64_13585 [Pirellulales bacterium]|nr:hypothetical protein [Pirellulales bacterium]